MTESKTSTRNDKRNFWRGHIDNWEAGNLSQKKYCEQEKISFASFSWWRTKGFKDKSKKAVSFVPAMIKNLEPLMVKDIQLILPNNARLILPSNMPIKDLASLIKLLGEVS